MMNIEDETNERPINILIVGSDPGLVDEFEDALEGWQGARPHLSYQSSLRQGLEAARLKRPELVGVEMDSDVDRLKQFAEELSLDSPGTTMAAIYRKDIFGSGEKESSAIISAIRANVSDFLRRPLSSEEVRQLLSRISSKRRREIHASGKVVSFIGNKGGVGKSTLSVNTACALAQKKRGNVLLVDASLQLGVCQTLLGVQPKATILDVIDQLDRLDETLLRQICTAHPSGLRLLPAPIDPASSARIDGETFARILSLARRAFDYTIVDTFPLLDAFVLSILDVSDHAFVVFQGSVPSVLGVNSFLNMLQELDFNRSRQSLILNQNIGRFSSGLSRVDVEDRIDRDVDFVVPYDRRVVEAGNLGRPLVLRKSHRFGFPKVVSKIAMSISANGAISTSPRERLAVSEVIEAKEEAP